MASLSVEPVAADGGLPIADNGLPDLELPYYFEDLYEPFRFLDWHGGRGGGKSRTVATGLIMQATERHERVLCGREVQKSIKDSVKRLLDDEIDRLGLRKAFVSTETEIRGPNDSLFLFAGIRGNANGIKSIEGITTFWGEEAQAFSQASLDTLIPTIRAPGSRLIFTWNPDLPTDPIDAMFRGEKGPPPNTISREINHDDNLWFPDVLREQMEFDRARDFDKYLHIWKGQHRKNSEARVFKNWSVEEFDTPGNVEFRLGADFGFSIDPSVAIRCWIDGTNLYVDHEAWGLGVEIDDLPKLFMTIPEAEKHWMTADSSRPETISYLRRNGFDRIAPALKGARSLEEGVEFLKAYDIVVHPRCVRLIDELTCYSYKTDSLTGQVLAAFEDKDNHCIDALRYAVEGARRALSGKARTVSITSPTLRYRRA
jgi:phage terminase large subunit